MAQNIRSDDLYNVVAVPGRVGLEECSLDLIFFKTRDRPFGFLFWDRV